MSLLLRVCVLLWLGLHDALAPAAGTSLGQALASAHQVLLMRHGYAPGVGDPPGYRLQDCSTQRNLDDAGRRQAESIGHWLRNQGVEQALVYSSPWCRCKDTAQGLGLGGYLVEPALGSFFDAPQDSAAQTRALAAFIAERLPAKGRRALILVTHHVNIAAFVGENVGTGDMVLVQVNAQGRYLSHRRYPSPG